MYLRIKNKAKIFYEDCLTLHLDGHNVNCMHGHHFQRKVINFISNNIPRFDRRIHQNIIDNKYPTYSDKWKIPVSVPLKYIVTVIQHCFVRKQIKQYY